MRCNSRDEHKQVEKSTRRLSVINQSTSMERSSRHADSSESLAKTVEISDSPRRDLESLVKHVESLVEHVENLMEHVESSVEHEVSLVSSVGILNCLIKLVEEVECRDRLGEQANILESLVGNLGSSDSSCNVDSSDLEQEVLSLQEQLHTEKDLRAVQEVQDEKCQLGMDDESGVKKAWELSDLLKRARPI